MAATGSARATAKKVAEPKPPAVVLARASESGDPAVHQIIAEMQSAQLNGDTDALSALTAQLAELGYE